MSLEDIPLPDYGNPISVRIYKMRVALWQTDFRFKNELTLIENFNKIDPTEEMSRNYLRSIYK